MNSQKIYSISISDTQYNKYNKSVYCLFGLAVYVNETYDLKHAMHVFRHFSAWCRSHRTQITRIHAVHAGKLKRGNSYPDTFQNVLVSSIIAFAALCTFEMLISYLISFQTNSVHVCGGSMCCDRSNP